MRRTDLISSIEELTGVNFDVMCCRGVVYKTENNNYSLSETIKTNKRKLVKLYEDIKYRKFIYIPF